MFHLRRSHSIPQNILSSCTAWKRCGTGLTTSVAAARRSDKTMVMFRDGRPNCPWNGFSSLALLGDLCDPFKRLGKGTPTSTRSELSSSQSSVWFSSVASSLNDHENDENVLWNAMAPYTRQLAFSILNASKGPHTHTTSSDSATTAKEATGDDSVNPRVALSRAITLMESKHPKKKQQGDYLLTYLLLQTATNEASPMIALSSPAAEDAISTEEPVTKPTLRVGIAGPPGAEASPMIALSSPAAEDAISTEEPVTKPTLRVGFAGPPGAGKSSLIEAFGMYLLEQDPSMKLAVVCIDPSSGISGGSILGDKTRMTELSRHDRAVVRPSANKGVLGGLSAYTDDVVRLLAAAEYPVVFIETVGLGQSEIEVVESVDVMVLLLPPSGGDELQGVKKGIVEMANILSVTKADGDLEPAAKRTATDYSGALRVLQQSNSSSTSGSGKNKGGNDGPWVPPVILTSSVTRRGLDELWKAIEKYRDYLVHNGLFDDRRQKQSKYWMWKQFTRMMQARMEDDPALATRAKQLEDQMLQGLLTPRVAAQELLDNVFETSSQPTMN